MGEFILVDEYTHDELKGKPKYFKQMTAIGPMATPDINEAERYSTEDEARQSPAHRHWSANWKIAPKPKAHTKIPKDKEL